MQNDDRQQDGENAEAYDEYEIYHYKHLSHVYGIVFNYAQHLGQKSFDHIS